MLKPKLIAFFTLVTCLSHVSGFLLTQEPVVNTDCGPVSGVSAGQNGPYSFRGIPYASPPVGQNRWSAPQEVTAQNGNCWTGTLNATEFGSRCFQPAQNQTFSGSEDCLFLNVWTPSLSRDGKLPVAVWIHGGYLLNGDGNTETYAPTEQLAQDTNIVYVSMNYRLNAFGFMALEWLAGQSPKNVSGNYGFMDMIAALRWVNRNIEAFGGDKNQVTVYGQSSGGTAILALLASPLATGLFQRAWLASASPLLNKTASDAYKDNMVFVRNTGCANVSCLYDLSPENVINSIPWNEYPYWNMMSDQNNLPTNGLFIGALAIVDVSCNTVCYVSCQIQMKGSFPSQIERTLLPYYSVLGYQSKKEGYVLLEPPFDAFVNGRGNDVPILLGTTAQEVDFFPPDSEHIATWNQTIYEERVRQKLSTFSDFIAEMALRLYPMQNQTAEFQFTSMISDLRMNCGNDYASLILAKSFRSRVYRYVMTYVPSIPFTVENDTFASRYSSHGVDVGAFYGSVGSFISPLSANDLAFQNIMSQEVTSFIKTGSPYTASWGPYPYETALLSGTVDIDSGYHTSECQFWFANGFLAYSWVN